MTKRTGPFLALPDVPTKVLFLDVNGVLDSWRTRTGLGYFAYESVHNFKYLDPVALGLLQNLVDNTGCSVVLSSTWRQRADEKWLASFSHHLGVQIHSITEKMSVLNKTRGAEVREWLTHFKVEQYAIVDDGGGWLPEQEPFVVQTSYDDGLLFSHYQQLLRLLT